MLLCIHQAGKDTRELETSDTSSARSVVREPLDNFSPVSCCLIYSKFLRNFHFFIHSNGHAFTWSQQGKVHLDTSKRVILQTRKNVEKVRVYLLVGKLLRKSPRDEENEDVHSPPQATEKLPEKIKKLEEI